MQGLPKIYSYVVARDYGFAPNPFHGVCTLATCKPRIRKAADLVGSASQQRAGFLVFAMKVEDTLTFDEYFGPMSASSRSALICAAAKSRRSATTSITARARAMIGNS